MYLTNLKWCFTISESTLKSRKNIKNIIVVGVIIAFITTCTFLIVFVSLNQQNAKTDDSDSDDDDDSAAAPPGGGGG